MQSEKELLERTRLHARRYWKRHHPKMKSQRIRSVRMVRQGNFTCVILNGKVVGMAKRHVKDQHNPNTAFHTALSKALRQLYA